MGAELDPYLKRLRSHNLNQAADRFAELQRNLITEGILPETLPKRGSKRLERIRKIASELRLLGQVNETTPLKTARHTKTLAGQAGYLTMRVLSVEGFWPVAKMFRENYLFYHDPSFREQQEETHRQLTDHFKGSGVKIDPLPDTSAQPDFNDLLQTLPDNLRGIMRLNLAAHFYPRPDLTVPKELDLRQPLQ